MEHACQVVPVACRANRLRRLFAGVALAVSVDLRDAVSAVQRGLRGERIHWTRLEKLHVTVVFFGATAPERIPEIAAALALAAAEHPPFMLHLGGLGIFGSGRHPRVLWMDVASAGLTSLHACVTAKLQGAGWTPEAQPFAPHLTLGRVRLVQDAREFRARTARVGTGTALVQEIRNLILYESIAGNYLPLMQWTLNPAPALCPGTVGVRSCGLAGA